MREPRNKPWKRGEGDVESGGGSSHSLSLDGDELL